MSNRKAAYIATIASKEAIPNKDRIAYFGLKNLGWKVVGSNDFSVGDKVVYIEYDTLIDDTTGTDKWAGFLREKSYDHTQKAFKVKARKMFGVISYGLILGLNEIPEMEKFKDKKDGFDLSEILNVRPKPEEESEVKKKEKLPWWKRLFKFVFPKLYRIIFNKGFNPEFPEHCANKTDETRIQNLTWLFEEKYKGTTLYVTEKIDGSSMTASVYNGRFIVASRNQRLYDKPLRIAFKEINKNNILKFRAQSKFLEVACRLNLPNQMIKFMDKEFIENLTIQGEVAGNGIQSNPLQLPEKELFVFNLYNPNKKQYCNFLKLDEFSKYTGIKRVPFKEETAFHWNSIEELEKYVQEDFEESIYPKGKQREGLVFRQWNPLAQHDYLPPAPQGMNGCFSFKVINPKYL